MELLISLFSLSFLCIIIHCVYIFLLLVDVLLIFLYFYSSLILYIKKQTNKQTNKKPDVVDISVICYVVYHLHMKRK